MSDIADQLSKVLFQYSMHFSLKEYSDIYTETDILMNTFGITQELKRENKQYWGRQLGKCWERLVVTLAQHYCADFKPALRIGSDEPCDLVIGNDAIDTKYRVGSGDSGTLKKFRHNANVLREHGYLPTMLVVRHNNLPAAIKSASAGGWRILTGRDTFTYLEHVTKFDLFAWLENHIANGTFLINRERGAV